MTGAWAPGRIVLPKLSVGMTMNSSPEGSGALPEVVVLFCQRCVRRPEVRGDVCRETPACRVRLVMLPCSSKIESVHVLKLLEKGAEAVEIVACPEERCRLLVGNFKAEKRIQYARRLLEEIRYGSQRVGMTRGTDFSEAGLIELATRRLQEVRQAAADSVPAAGQTG